MTIQEKQDAIIAEFAPLHTWMEKYEHIIQKGKQLPTMDSTLKIDDNLIRGCQAKVWLFAHVNEGEIQLTADSDTLITKGLIALIIQIFHNESAREILKADLYVFDKIGLKEHLEPTRANGLLSMIKHIKLLALSAGR